LFSILSSPLPRFRGGSASSPLNEGSSTMFQKNLLIERLQLLKRRDNIVTLLGNVPTQNTDFSWNRDGSGSRGDVNKAEGLLRWSKTSNGLKKLKEQNDQRNTNVTPDKRSTFEDALIAFRARQVELMKAATQEVLMYEKQLKTTELNIAAWEVKNPDYSLLTIEDIQEHLDNLDPSGESNIPQTTAEQRLIEAEHTQQLADTALENILSQ
jgi:hypothetical protein